MKTHTYSCGYLRGECHIPTGLWLDLLEKGFVLSVAAIYEANVISMHDYNVRFAGDESFTFQLRLFVRWMSNLCRTMVRSPGDENSLTFHSRFL
ncbi:hypothetical protein PoB_003661400 [Plakobranchus ocellatus]|uniref:Uncharacterized protein n=1 Tax=Plakobranchus ocellatus TaxID=259542 RepID=A0AAV4AVH2_9GAST|nr:hypothetical protein PoB_003661400 [Plakobranchus ocellatus]